MTKLHQVASVLHQIVIESPKLAETTRDKYLRDLNAWIMFAGDNPKGWSRRKVQEFYNSMLLRGLKPQSATRVLASVQYASKWWAAYEEDPKLDFAKLIETSPPKRRSKRSALTEEEAMALLEPMLYEQDDALAKRDFAMLVVMLETGMRRMSIMSMQIATTQIDHGDAPPHTLVLLKGKNDELFTVPLSDVAGYALRPWLGYLREQGVRHGPVFRSLWRKGNGYVISETAIGKSAIANIVSDRAKAGKLARTIHPHLFRHTFVTWRAAAGYPPHEIASMTGHTLKGLGALGGYIDTDAYRERIRSSTPAFLRNLLGFP